MSNITDESVKFLIDVIKNKVTIPSGIKEEERELEPLLLTLFKDAIRKANLKLDVFPSVGGEKGTAKSIKLFGTDFWPDFAFHDINDTPIFALETKLVKSDQSPASSISEAIGQAVIYQMVYPSVGILIIHRGSDRGPLFHEFDKKFLSRLENQKIYLIFK